MGALAFVGIAVMIVVCVLLLVRASGVFAPDEGPDRFQEAYRASSWHEAQLVAGLMRDAGVSVVLRNADLVNAAGALPMQSVLPTIWVHGDAELERAQEVVRAYRERAAGDPSADAADWICAACGEENPSNFELCWSCRKAREVGGDAGRNGNPMP